MKKKPNRFKINARFVYNDLTLATVHFIILNCFFNTVMTRLMSRTTHSITIYINTQHHLPIIQICPTPHTDTSVTYQQRLYVR